MVFEGAGLDGLRWFLVAPEGLSSASEPVPEPEPDVAVWVVTFARAMVRDLFPPRTVRSGSGPAPSPVQTAGIVRAAKALAGAVSDVERRRGPLPEHDLMPRLRAACRWLAAALDGGRPTANHEVAAAMDAVRRLAA